MYGSRPLPGLSRIFARCLPTGKAVASLCFHAKCWIYYQHGINVHMNAHSCSPRLRLCRGLKRWSEKRKQAIVVTSLSLSLCHKLQPQTHRRKLAGCMPSQWLRVELVTSTSQGDEGFYEYSAWPIPTFSNKTSHCPVWAAHTRCWRVLKQSQACRVIWDIFRDSRGFPTDLEGT